MARETKVKKVSEKKKALLESIVKLIEKYDTVMIVSIMSIPSAQLQRARKKFKGVEVRVVKKNIAVMALEKAKKENIRELSSHLSECNALFFSNLDAYELASLLTETRAKARAKPGQIALKEIAVETGATDLPPGPIISELGAAGIKAGMEGGKIVIKQRKVLVNKGEKITKSAADILAKLEIMPFTTEIEPISAYDSKDKKIYSGIKIDKEGTISNMQKASQESINLAVFTAYPAKETIAAIIIKAARQLNALQNKLSLTKEVKQGEENKTEEKNQ